MHPHAATHAPFLTHPIVSSLFFSFSFINGNTLREYFFSQQLSVANSSWLGWDFVSTCPLPAGTWCGFSFHGLVITATSSYVQLPCCVRRILIPCLHSPPLSPSLSGPSLFQWSLRLGRRGRRLEAPLRAEYSVGSYSAPWLVMSLCGDRLLQIDTTLI